MPERLTYPIILEPNGEGGFIVRFPDFPEAITEGATREEAVREAVDCLDVALLSRLDDGEDFPGPSEEGDGFVYPSAEIAAKIQLIRLWRAAGISKTALAGRLGVKEPEARRILDPRHNTKLATMNAAARALGGHFEVRFVPE